MRLREVSTKVRVQSELLPTLITSPWLKAAAPAAGALPVKLRNISSTGALLESGAIPEPGTAVELRRAAQSASGRVMWREDGKAGVHFDRPTEVELLLGVNAAAIGAGARQSCGLHS